MTNIIENMVDYSRQEAMTDDLHGIQERHQVIVGCGGIGYWLAIQLALMGAESITLIDGDKIEPSNLNRLPSPLRMSGEWKVKAIKAQLRLLRPTIKIVCLPMHITEDTLAMLPTNNAHVWDCTDDARIQKLLSKYAMQQGVVYTKAGYEGWNIGLYSKMEDMWIQDGYAPGYTTSKANAVSSMMAAGLAILYAGRRVDADVHIDLQKLVETGNKEA